MRVIPPLPPIGILHRLLLGVGSDRVSGLASGPT
jgi:hypothetical protein